MARQTTTNPYLAEFQRAQDQARRANEQRYQQMMEIFDNVIAQYQPGGTFGQGAMALYEQGKGKAMASGMQSLVSSGLSNTTVAAGLPLAYEQEVGSPFRMQLEDMRQSRLSEAQMAKAGGIERRQDIGPDAGLLAQLMQQSAPAGSGPSVGGSSDINAAHSAFMDRLRGGGSAGGGSGMPSGTAGGGYIGGAGVGGSLPGYISGGGSVQTGGGYTGATTPRMDEDEYQKLLQENLARNQGFQPTGTGGEAEPFHYVPEGGGAQTEPTKNPMSYAYQSWLRSQKGKT